MRRFLQSQIREAVRHATDGGQALHTHKIIGNRKTAPKCFVGAVDRGEDIAHLFDRDGKRLVTTAKRLGVRVIRVEREGTDKQHIDLCGGPLRKALAMCEGSNVQGFFGRTELAVRKPMPRIADCGRCGLWESCTSPKMPVAGKGKRGILVIGESPGESEDRVGKPFVGPSGQKLQEALSRFDIDLFRDCWVTNALVCHPKGNEIENDKSIEWCRPNVLREIRERKPVVVILLGGVATRSVLGAVTDEDVRTAGKWMGWQIPLQKWNCWVCPTHHPARMLHERNQDRTDLIEREWVRHLGAAVEKTERPWKKVPDYRGRVVVELDDKKAADEILTVAGHGGAVAFDYETTTLKPYGPHAEIVCCSVSNGDYTIAFPWHGDAADAMAGVLRDGAVHKVAANAKFEEVWTKNKLGFRVRGWHWDTMLAMHALDSRTGITGLGVQAMIWLGQGDWSSHVSPYLKSDGGGNAPNRVREVPIRDLLSYCGTDALLEYKIYERQRAAFGEV